MCIILCTCKLHVKKKKCTQKTEYSREKRWCQPPLRRQIESRDCQMLVYRLQIEFILTCFFCSFVFFSHAYLICLRKHSGCPMTDVNQSWARQDIHVAYESFIERQDLQMFKRSWKPWRSISFLIEKLISQRFNICSFYGFPLLKSDAMGERWRYNSCQKIIWRREWKPLPRAII